MKEEIKELLEHIKILDNTDYILHSDKAKALLDYITNLQHELEKLKFNHKQLKDIDKIQKAFEDYKSRCENAQDLILNELSHLKASDEETWNKEFYDENNKLDYRKLCIELLNQVANLLDGGDKE